MSKSQVTEQKFNVEVMYPFLYMYEFVEGLEFFSLDSHAGTHTYIGALNIKKSEGRKE